MWFWLREKHWLIEEYRSRAHQVWNSGVHRDHCNFTERKRGMPISEAMGKMIHNMEKMKLDSLPQATIKSIQPTFLSLYFPCSLLFHFLFLSQHVWVCMCMYICICVTMCTHIPPLSSERTKKHCSSFLAQ